MRMRGARQHHGGRGVRGRKGVSGGGRELPQQGARAPHLVATLRVPPTLLLLRCVL